MINPRDEFTQEEIDTNPGLLRLQAAQDLAAEFGTDVEEWL